MRLYPPIYTAMAVAAMVALDRWAPLARMWPATWLGAIPAALGLGLVLWAAWVMHRRGTTLHPFAQATTLVVSGPFRFSRNPIYLGFALALAGLAGGLGTSSPWAALSAWLFAINHLFIQPEEAALSETFGADFTAYTHKVRRWF